MKRRYLLTALLVAAFLAPALIMAQDKPQAKPAPELKKAPVREVIGERLQGRMMPRLNLTEEQKQKIGQIRLDAQKEVIKINSEIALNKVEIKKLLADKGLNTQKFSSLSDGIVKLEGELKKIRTDNWLKIYSLLNDEQKEIWKKQIGRERMMGRGMANRPAMRQMANRMVERRQPIEGRAVRGMQMRMRMAQPQVEKEVIIEKK